MLTFAYGSNMDCGQMKDRCPSVSFVCVAVLRDYRLCFPRKSKKRDCGVAGVERGEGCNVWGVVYEINEADVGNLDATEGYRNKDECCRPDSVENSPNTNLYFREQCYVYQDDSNDNPIYAWVYIACPETDPPHPNVIYKQQIVEGARYWNLPAEYISKIEQIETA